MVKKEKMKSEPPPPESEDEEGSDSDGSEEQYQVEVITKARVAEDCNWEYYVKWAGFGEESNSWEPFENVQGCDRLLDAFWEDIGMDNKDYPVGTICSASPEFIRREKKFFAKHFGKDVKPKKEPKIAFSTAGAKSKKKKPPKPLPADSESESDSDKEPLRKKRPVQSESDDDRKPLRKARKVSREPSTSKIPEAGSSKVSGRPREASVASSSKSKAKSREPSAKMTKSVANGADKRQSSVASSSKGSAGSKEKPATSKSKPPVTAEKRPTPVSTSSAKGKERAVTPPPPAQADESTSPHSLFSAASAASSPDISLSQLPSSDRPAPQPKSNLPSHKERKVIPKIKMIDPPPVQAPSGAAPAKPLGISTKARLSMGAAMLSPVGTTAPQLPDPAQQRKSLSGLSFSKKKVSVPDVQNPSSTQNPTAGSSSFGQPQTLLQDSEIVQSPVDMQPMDTLNSFAVPAPLPLPRSRNASLQLPRTPSMASTVPSQPPSLEAQADAFLADIMPPELAAPMQEDPTPVVSTSTAPMNIGLGKTIVPAGKIQKRFKWEGELYVESGQDSSRLLCKATMNEVSDLRPNGLPLKVCLADVSSLRLKKLLDVSDLYIVLPACAAVTQFCKLGPAGADDSAAFKQLKEYMQRKRLFTYAPAFLDEDTVGLYIVFPPALADISNLFRLPPNLRSTDALVVALCPWALTQTELQQYNWIGREIALTPGEPLLDPAYDDIMRKTSHKVLVGNPLYQCGLRILKFPKYLHDFMSQPNRPYGVYYAQTAVSPNAPPAPPDGETACLLAILNQCGATNVGLKADVKALFIHIGCLPLMGMVPAMWMRRAKRPELRIFTYGTHESVAPSRWGVREIYPIGGVVTFTPRSILENPIGVNRLIQKMDKHPLWDCFIPPAAVGAIAKLSCGQHDPLVLLDKEESFCGPLLSLIVDGKISLLTAPPNSRRPQKEGNKWRDPELTWLNGQYALINMSEREILAACVDAFDELFPKAAVNEIQAHGAKHTYKEMDSMQFQPAIMDDYRRYVVVKGEKESIKDERELLEVITLDAFDFKDEFFADSGVKRKVTNPS